MGPSCDSSLRVVNESGFQILWLKDECLEADAQYFRQHRSEIDGVGLARSQGFRGTSTAFLRDWDIKALVVSGSDNVDLRPIKSMPGLRVVSYADRAQPLDLRRLTSLEVLDTTWHARMQFPTDLRALRRCVLRRYSPKHGSLTDLSGADGLQRLELVQGRLRCLRGIPASVRMLELFRLSTLWNIDDLPAGVEDLRIIGCKLIPDYRPISRCGRLRTIALEDCGDIPSLGFLDSLAGVERVALIGSTRIVDGNLHPLIGVHRVTLDDRRSYNLTLDEIRRITASH